MRQDKVIFNGINPFLSFSKCKELTVFLQENGFVFIGSTLGANIMISFNSQVSMIGDNTGLRTAFSIPLSLILPAFKIDTREKNNSLELETNENDLRIMYNGVSIDTPLFAANGLTLQQVQSITTNQEREFNALPFKQMAASFGSAKDVFCNVVNDKLFISNSQKCLIYNSPTDYMDKFSMPIAFLRALRDMNCNKIYFGDAIVGVNESGVWVVCNRYKVQNEAVLLDYKFAARTKSDEIYRVNLSRLTKLISAVNSSKELSLRFDIEKRELKIISETGQTSNNYFDESEIKFEGTVDFFAEKKFETPIISDVELVKAMASHGSSKVKLTPLFAILQLGKEYRMLFKLVK